MRLCSNMALAAAALALFTGGSAWAQSAADQQAVAYQSARNQLGVLEYCQDKGYLDSSAVDTQKKIMTQLPTPSDTSAGDAAEATGRKGTVSSMGQTMDIETVSKQRGTTAEAMCKQMGQMLAAAAAQLPK